MADQSRFVAFIRRQPRWRFVVVLAGVLTAVFLLKGGAKPVSNGLSYAARRGPLDIAVLEGGSVQALESQEIKCEVRVGYQGLKILKIVEEGYQVTEEDIRTNKLLVELDSSELQNQVAQQEIQFQSAAASYVDAQQGYDIQVNQNLSDVRAAEQKARFARMDFSKYMGDQAASEITERLGLKVDLETPWVPPTNALNLAELESAPPSQPARANGERPLPPPAAGTAPASEGTIVVMVTPTDAPPVANLVPKPEPTAPPPATDSATNATPGPPALKALPALNIDFTKYAQIELLGDGEAKQKLRDLVDGLQVAKKEREQALATLEGTRRLHAKDFVAKLDLDRDEMAYTNSYLKVLKAETAENLFRKYEFPKAAEESLSKFAEALRELDRARKAALSKLAQAEAKLRSTQGQYHVQLKRKKELEEQLGKCVIQAKKPGLVVYGSGDESRFWRGEEQIREGATVRERQSIITIPDMTKMSAQVKIHETYIKKVKKGQKARITVDAFADKVLEGEVTNVGVLPDSENRWMNPDMKVYRTTITITGVHDWLKPGMSAKVEIFVDRLSDVVYVPMQAVFPREGKQVCYMASASRPQPREVEIGQFNDEFIEIKKGITEGEKVLLRPPEGSESVPGATPAAPAMAGDGQKVPAKTPEAAPQTAPPKAPQPATPKASTGKA